jgi:hypothetical protein
MLDHSVKLILPLLRLLCYQIMVWSLFQIWKPILRRSRTTKKGRGRGSCPTEPPPVQPARRSAKLQHKCLSQLIRRHALSKNEGVRGRWTPAVTFAHARRAATTVGQGWVTSELTGILAEDIGDS